MSKLILVTAAGLLIATSSVAAINPGVQNPNAATKAEVSQKMQSQASFNFGIFAKTATITKSNNQYVLVLSEVPRKVAFFSDRPDRIFGHIHPQEFAKLWQGDGTFKQNPPNGYIFGKMPDGKEYSNFIVINSMLFDPNKETHTFSIIFEENPPSDNLELRDVGLFIDNVSSQAYKWS